MTLPTVTGLVSKANVGAAQSMAKTTTPTKMNMSHRNILAPSKYARPTDLMKFFMDTVYTNLLGMSIPSYYSINPLPS